MKILMLSWNFPPTVGGIESLIGHLFEGLLRAGHRVDVITTAAPSVETRESVYRAAGPGVPRFLSFSLVRGRHLCRESRPDLILCGSVVSVPVGLFLSKLYRIPFALISYGSDLVHPGWLCRPVSRWLFRRAPLVVAISNSTRELLLGIGVPSERITLIYPGVSVEDFESEPTGCGEALLERIKGRRVLLSVGRIVRRKGLAEFVEQVMPGLVQTFPELILVVAGDDATKSLVHGERIRGRIEAIVGQKGLEDHVVLTGTLPYEEIVRLFFRSDLFVLPAICVPGDAEGFGIVFLEAALAGSPSVATNIGGIPEAVLDGVTGLLVEPGDCEGLRAAVTRMLTDEAFRTCCAEAAATRARNEFSWDVITSKYVDAFREIVP